MINQRFEENEMANEMNEVTCDCNCNRKKEYSNGTSVAAVSIKLDQEQDQHQDTKESPAQYELLYGIEDNPPFYMCIFLGFQHYLEMLGATIACPFILTPALCMDDDDPDKANIINTLIFMSGIITILQSTIGSRLPIVQGGSFSYLVPSLAILTLPKWQCPSAEEFATLTPEQKTEEWQIRMREIQGAIIFAALFEVIFSITGFIGYIVKFITPLTIAPAITLIGLTFFKNVAEQCAKNYYVSFGVLFLLIITSQHLSSVQVGIPGKSSKFPLFQVFPVLISIGIVWAICAILTATDLLPEDNAARTDSKQKIFEGAPWFRVPYPFQWGWPTVSVGAVAGVLCGVLTSTIESLGDYFACATLANATVPPTHALNRGIFMEGLGCVLSGIWGSGNGSTSYSNNIGTITITKVASRRVIIYAGFIMVLLSLVGKVGAIFIGLPDPLLGGTFCYIFPLIMAVGIGTLEEVSLISSRNIFIVSFAIFGGLAISQFTSAHPGLINTGTLEIDNLIQILLSTGMFMAAFIGFVLDNTIPGTNEERGLALRLKAQEDAKKCRDASYDIPYVMKWIHKLEFMKWVPISPTYEKHLLTKLPFFRNKQ